MRCWLSAPTYATLISLTPVFQTLPSKGEQCYTGSPACYAGSPACYTGSPACYTGSPACYTGSPDCYTGSPACYAGSPACYMYTSAETLCMQFRSAQHVSVYLLQAFHNICWLTLLSPRTNVPVHANLTITRYTLLVYRPMYKVMGCTHVKKCSTNYQQIADNFSHFLLCTVFHFCLV